MLDQVRHDVKEEGLSSRSASILSSRNDPIRDLVLREDRDPGWEHARMTGRDCHPVEPVLKSLPWNDLIQGSYSGSSR
jgi:hypothetical protein